MYLCVWVSEQLTCSHGVDPELRELLLSHMGRKRRREAADLGVHPADFTGLHSCLHAHAHARTSSTRTAAHTHTRSLSVHVNTLTHYREQQQRRLHHVTVWAPSSGSPPLVWTEQFTSVFLLKQPPCWLHERTIPLCCRLQGRTAPQWPQGGSREALRLLS